MASKKSTAHASADEAAPAVHVLHAALAAHPLRAVSQRWAQLFEQARLRQLQREDVFADVVVVRTPEGLAQDSSELQTVQALNLGHAQRFLQPVSGRAAPKVDVLRRLDHTLVMKANTAAVQALRHASPGLKISSATYLYPQYLHPLGESLASAAIQVAPGAKVRKFTVRLRNAAGQAVANVKVSALVDWASGAHVAATTDKNGDAAFGIPVLYPRVELITAEPQHTYWPVYREGFDRMAAPKRLDVTLASLVPDAFGLMSFYAPWDEQAGQGVTVGVIDSGVGPHQDIGVTGGACLVTGEDETDFLDNGIGHGTHVAGIIKARQSAGGVYGVAPACTLMAYRVCPKTGATGRAKSVDVAAALERAISDGCDLVNISLGSLEAMPEVPGMLERARNAGMVVLAATGNDGRELMRYPARYSHTLGVGALGRDATCPADCPEKFQESEIRRGKEFVAEFSNYGLGTDFIGPGVAVISTYPKDRYAMMSGTSMATPFTTGMAARLLSKAPNVLTMARGPERADAIVRLLTEAGRKPGWPDVYGGFGVLK